MVWGVISRILGVFMMFFRWAVRPLLILMFGGIAKEAAGSAPIGCGMISISLAMFAWLAVDVVKLIHSW